jgi:hypothetical protein
VAREVLSTFIGVDLADFPFDAPFPDVKPTARSSGSFHNWVGLAKQEGLTMRQLALRAARGRMSVTKGSPQQIADHMED